MSPSLMLPSEPKAGYHTRSKIRKLFLAYSLVIPGIVRGLEVEECAGGMRVVVPPTPSHPPRAGRDPGRAEEQETMQVKDFAQDEQHDFRPFRMRNVT